MRREVVRAAWAGVRDGYALAGGELHCGLTWEDDPAANEAYDSGVNLGESLQALRDAFHNLRCHVRTVVRNVMGGE